jgi:hypothetical protein
MSEVTLQKVFYCSVFYEFFQKVSNSCRWSTRAQRQKTGPLVAATPTFWSALSLVLVVCALLATVFKVYRGSRATRFKSSAIIRASRSQFQRHCVLVD